jgi:hypothetical protein
MQAVKHSAGNKVHGYEGENGRKGVSEKYYKRRESKVKTHNN